MAFEEAILLLRSLFIVLCLSLPSLPAWAGKRVALVIGNGRYENANWLAQPSADADAIASLLQVAGFDRVDVAKDLTLARFRQALEDFAPRTENADVVLIYFSGHGLDVAGTTYLLPIDAVLKKEDDVAREAVALTQLQRRLSSGHGLKLVLLDASRKNPFPAGMLRASSEAAVAGGNGGTEPSAPDVVVFRAATTGTFAADGKGANSPFTQALLKHLGAPGLDVQTLLARVRDEVAQITKDRPFPQVPVYFGSPGTGTPPVAPAVSPAAAEASRSSQGEDREAGEKQAAGCFTFNGNRVCE